MKAEPFLVGLRLEGRPCVVVGSGAEAATRAELLARSGANVLVVSSRPDVEVARLAEQGAVRLERRDFSDADLDEAWLAVLADVDEALAEQIAEAAERRRVWFCAIDQPRFGSYFHAAIARCGALAVAISTGGKAPGLARRLRQELERLFLEAGMAEFLAKLAERRASTPPADRRRVLDKILDRVSIRGRLDVPHDV